MISFLKGILVETFANHVTIDVHGVGYEVSMPLSSVESIGRPGDEVLVLTHFHVREQEQTLYGFCSADERDLFRLLLNRVSGVGPKMAMAVLSGMSVADFKSAVVAGDTAALARIKGLGTKTAERIVLELKDRIGVAAAWEIATGRAGPSAGETRVNDAVLALISLGYKQAEAQKAVRLAISSAGAGTEIAADALLRASLRILN
jgi:Holliday junction DNA helicase RuvA